MQQQCICSLPRCGAVEVLHTRFEKAAGTPEVFVHDPVHSSSGGVRVTTRKTGVLLLSKKSGLSVNRLHDVACVSPIC